MQGQGHKGGGKGGEGGKGEGNGKGGKGKGKGEGSVRMSDCLQGIELCECKGKGHQWIGNQVFRLAKEMKK